MFWFIIGSIVIIFLIIGFTLGNSEVRRRNEVEYNINQLLKEREFNPSQLFITQDKNSAIAFDEFQNKICIISNDNNNITYHEISHSNILQSEIIEDDISITRTSRSSQVGGVLLGGIIGGGIGALIGGLSGKQTSESEVKSVKLQIVENDREQPIKIVTFLKSDFSIKKSTNLYKDISEKINHWHKLITVLIKKADSKDSQKLNSM